MPPMRSTAKAALAISLSQAGLAAPSADRPYSLSTHWLKMSWQRVLDVGDLLVQSRVLFTCQRTKVMVWVRASSRPPAPSGPQCEPMRGASSVVANRAALVDLGSLHLRQSSRCAGCSRGNGSLPLACRWAALTNAPPDVSHGVVPVLLLPALDQPGDNEGKVVELALPFQIHDVAVLS